MLRFLNVFWKVLFSGRFCNLIRTVSVWRKDQHTRMRFTAVFRYFWMGTKIFDKMSLVQFEPESKLIMLCQQPQPWNSCLSFSFLTFSSFVGIGKGNQAEGPT